MADFFRSALGYIGNVAGTSDNDFVGQNVELGQQKLRVKRVIAEGGWNRPCSCCWLAVDVINMFFVLNYRIINIS